MASGLSIYRLPDHVDRFGNTWAFWPWILSDHAGLWERFGTEEEAIARKEAIEHERQGDTT